MAQAHTFSAQSVPSVFDQPALDRGGDALRNNTLPPALFKNRDLFTAATAHAQSSQSLHLDPGLILDLARQWDRDFITLIQKGLASGDLETSQVWEILCKNCAELPQPTILNLLTEGMQVRHSPAAIQLSIAILHQPSFRQDLELVSASVHALRNRDPLELLPCFDALVERAVDYANHLWVDESPSRKERKRHLKRLAKENKKSGIPFTPEVLDLAGAACMYLLMEMPKNPSVSPDPFVRELLEKNRVHLCRVSIHQAQRLARRHPTSINPWVEIAAKLAPRELIEWHADEKRARSRMILPRDMVNGLVRSVLDLSIWYVSAGIVGMFAGNFGRSVSFGVFSFWTVYNAFQARKKRREMADVTLPPVHKEYLDKTVERLRANNLGVPKR
jgi:hypothetical protein